MSLFDIRDGCCENDRTACRYHEGWMDAADIASDAATEAEMRLAYLRDVVEAVVGSRSIGKHTQERLLDALRATERPASADSRHATPEDDSPDPTPTEGASE